MSLLHEYRKQYAWRDWKRALSLCPISPGQQVLDLGCGPGDISAELSARGASVLGIDENLEFLEAATCRCPECRFEKQDLNCLQLEPAAYDGIWSSFTAAYFVDFASTFSRWLPFLRPTAWVCIVDIDDLLATVLCPNLLNARSQLSMKKRQAAGAMTSGSVGNLNPSCATNVSTSVRLRCMTKSYRSTGQLARMLFKHGEIDFREWAGLKLFWGTIFQLFETNSFIAFRTRIINHNVRSSIALASEHFFGESYK